MDAVVLAGGYATRLWPITRHRPKMFLPIGETTVIDRILSELERDPRIENVYISTNERFTGDFETHLTNAEFTKPQLSVEETIDEDEKLGVIGALAQLVDRENLHDEDLLVVAGDNLISFDISDFIDFFEHQQNPILAAYDVGSTRKASQYGIVELDGNRVVDFQEKPDNPLSSLISIACYAFPAEDITFTEYLADDNNPDEPGWFIQWLQNRRPVDTFTFDEAWFDIGTPENYLDAVAWHFDGKNFVAEDATVDDADLHENIHIMSGATVTNSTLDRTVVFPNATIEDSDLRASIIDEQAILQDLDLVGALVGAHSQIP